MESRVADLGERKDLVWKGGGYGLKIKWLTRVQK